MQKPPRTIPRRRWYHRYALVEVCETHESVHLLSWHMFLVSAGGSQLDLMTEQEAGRIPADIRWEILPAAAWGPLC